MRTHSFSRIIPICLLLHACLCGAARAEGTGDPATSGVGATISGTMRARIVQLNQVSGDRALLDFGRFNAPPGLRPASSGPVALQPVPGQERLAGQIHISGEPGLKYTMTPAALVRLVNVADPATVLFVTVAGAPENNNMLDAMGQSEFDMDHHLTAWGQQKPGSYQGVYPLTVTYD